MEPRTVLAIASLLVSIIIVGSILWVAFSATDVFTENSWIATTAGVPSGAATVLDLGFPISFNWSSAFEVSFFCAAAPALTAVRASQLVMFTSYYQYDSFLPNTTHPCWTTDSGDTLIDRVYTLTSATYFDIIISICNLVTFVAAAVAGGWWLHWTYKVERTFLRSQLAQMG